MDKFERALSFAVEVHRGMRRKREGVPYILHPMEVVTIASTLTSDVDVLCAALLHDVVEDTDTTIDDVRDVFGDRVAFLVACETEDKRPDLPPRETWNIRKRESLVKLRETNDRDVHILWLSDKLSNMRSFARLHERLGDAMWHGFNQSDPARQAWYYSRIRDAISDLSDTPAWREFDFLVDQVFEGVM